MLESILERPSLEESQADSTLNGTAAPTPPPCQEASNGIDGIGGATVAADTVSTFLVSSSLPSTAFAEVRNIPRQIVGARQQGTSPLPEFDLHLERVGCIA
jgi:hypothetical protein